MRTRTFAVLAVALLAASAAPALTADELKCQDAIAKSARGYFKAHMQTVSGCEDDRADGSVAPTVECRPKRCSGGDNDGLACGIADDCPSGACVATMSLDAKVADKLQSAADKVTKKVGAKCADPVPSAVVLGLPCGTTAPLAVADVASCIVDEAHGVGAARLLTTIYDATEALTNAATRTCQETLAKEARNFASARLNRRRNCAKKLAAGKLAGPCPD